MEIFSNVDAIILYFWILVAVCVLLIVTGIILLAGRKKRKNGMSGTLSSQVVHRASDLSVGMDSAHEPSEAAATRESGIAESCAVNFHSGYDRQEEPVAAIPVAPYTNWDHPENPEPGEPEASFAGFVIRESLGTEEPVMSASSSSRRSSGSKPELDPRQQLLLLKSHELLLTLSDGLKKISTAKTDTARKEKIVEMQAAMKLLDVKNEWDDYKACFEKLYPNFWPAIELLSSEEMSPYELRLCALLSLDMGTKEIADLTNRSVRTVETTIYKIRKKLGMDTEDRTQDFLKRIRNN